MFRGAENMNKNFCGGLIFAAAFVFFLAGCALETPTNLTQKRAEIHEKDYETSLKTAEVNENVGAVLASHYARYGDGPVSLSVTYDPHSSVYTARHATQDAARIASLLRSNGITSGVKTQILPIHNVGDESHTVFNYDIYVARPPAGCENMSEIIDSSPEDFRSYELGCSTEIYLAKQLSRPKDLMGREGIDESSGGRGTNIVQFYRTGAENEPLDSLTTTE